MQASEHQTWRISVHTKAKNFNFKFKAWKTNGTRLSLRVKIRQFFLKMVSETGCLVESRQRSGSKWKFLRFLKKIHARRIGNKISVNKERSNIQHPQTVFVMKRSDSLLCEESMAGIIGNLGLLSNSVSIRNYHGITVHAVTTLFYLFLLFKSFITKKAHVLVASVASSIGFSLGYLKYQGHISYNIWKAWNQVVSFWCLYLLVQVMLSRFSLFVERSKLVAFLISTLLPLLHIILDEIEWMRRNNHAIKVGPTSSWPANLLLAFQALFNLLRNPKDPKTLLSFVPSAHFLVNKLAYIWGP